MASIQKKTSTGFVVTRKTSEPGWRRTAALAVVVAALMGLASWLTTYVKVPELAATKKALSESNLALAEATASVDALARRQARLEQEVEVASSAREELLQALTEKQSELAQAREDLNFYQRLVGQGGQREGLTVHSLLLVPTSSQRVFRFEVTLSQNLRRAGIISGNLDMTIEGIESDRPKRLRIRDLMAENPTDLSFRFKYFQLLDGSIMLPEDFVPERIIVNINPDQVDKDSDGPTPQAFGWQAALEGVNNV